MGVLYTRDDLCEEREQQMVRWIPSSGHGDFGRLSSKQTPRLQFVVEFSGPLPFDCRKEGWYPAFQFKAVGYNDTTFNRQNIRTFGMDSRIDRSVEEKIYGSRFFGGDPDAITNLEDVYNYLYNVIYN